MTGKDCEAVRDLLPERVLDRLDDVSRERVDRHVATCADCSMELDLVRLINSARLHAPPSLRDRALARLRKPQRPAWSTRNLAIAASVAFALLTGTLLWTRAGSGPAASEAGRARAEPIPVSLASDDPLLHGGPGLIRLSEDELARLLAEMGS